MTSDIYVNVPARCRVKVALCHTYIILPQVTSHQRMLDQAHSRRGHDKGVCHFKKENKKEWKYQFPFPSPNPNPNCYTKPSPLDHEQLRVTVHKISPNGYHTNVVHVPYQSTHAQYNV